LTSGDFGELQLDMAKHIDKIAAYKSIGIAPFEKSKYTGMPFFKKKKSGKSR